MEWQAAASLALGYFGQYLKAMQSVPTPLAQALIGVAAIGLYALDHSIPAMGFGEWAKGGIMWALAVLGVSSLSAGLKAAPRTDSIQGGPQ